MRHKKESTVYLIQLENQRVGKSLVLRRIHVVNGTSSVGASDSASVASRMEGGRLGGEMATE